MADGVATNGNTNVESLKASKVRVVQAQSIFFRALPTAFG
jgi:hypothetical protein